MLYKTRRFSENKINCVKCVNPVSKQGGKAQTRARAHNATERARARPTTVTIPKTEYAAAAAAGDTAQVEGNVRNMQSILKPIECFCFSGMLALLNSTETKKKWFQSEGFHPAAAAALFKLHAQERER